MTVENVTTLCCAFRLNTSLDPEEPEELIV